MTEKRDRPSGSGDMLNLELFAIFTTPVASREAIQAMLPEHLAYQVELERRGVMFAAGPRYDKEGASLGGLIIYRAASFEEAEAIALADPMHKSGLRQFTIERWRVNEGTLTVKVNFSDQTMSLT